MKVQFPDIKEIFLPDKGFDLIDIDLEGADAQVVAWDANAEGMKDAFRKGLKIHAVNAELMFPDEGDYNFFKAKSPGLSEKRYQECKIGCHATNYGVGVGTLSAHTGWRQNEARNFQQRYFSKRPEIKQWHKKVEYELLSTGAVENQFGFKTRFFDRLENCFTNALAYKPQSTVLVVCMKGALSIRKYLYPDAQILLQVHDSLVIQIQKRKRNATLRQMHEMLHEIEVPYEDPLIIPWGLSLSSKNWGDCKPRDWNEFL